jgi:hypothetical protein
MSDSHSVIDRREAIRRTALLLGGVISAPTVAGLLSGCSIPSADAAAPRALTAHEFDLVASIAEHILPQTDTPGARAVGVHRFIDTMLAEYYNAGDRARFIEGLHDVDVRAQRLGAKGFLEATPAQQHTVLTALDQQAYPTGTGPTLAAAAHPHFFRIMKELTLLGYFTSEVGATKELRYVQVPGKFEGCVPMRRIGRAWAV